MRERSLIRNASPPPEPVKQLEEEKKKKPVVRIPIRRIPGNLVVHRTKNEIITTDGPEEAEEQKQRVIVSEA